MDKAATAELLMSYIRQESVSSVNTLMPKGSSGWREVVRYEFPLDKLKDNILQYEILLPGLESCEVTTMSALHLAALGGQSAILSLFLDRDIAVDMALASGSTPLHLACFAGHVDTAKTLIVNYQANVNRVDKYGWSALHYAATRGHLAVCELLVESGVKIALRDKDGTSAAYRAYANDFEDVVNYLVSTSGDDDLLNIGSDHEDEEDEIQEPLYATLPPAKLRSQSASQDNNPAASNPPELPPLRPKSMPSSIKSLPERRVSRRSCYSRVFVPPPQINNDDDDDDPDYMKPMDVLALAAQIAKQNQNGDKTDSATKSGFSDGTSDGDMDDGTFYDEYDDLYVSLRQLGPAPLPPTRNSIKRPVSSRYSRRFTVYTEIDDEDSDEDFGSKPFEFVEEEAPVLPPRNPNTVLREAAKSGDELYMRCPSVMPSNEVLKETLYNIAPQISANWKDLARVLPLSDSTHETDRTIGIIERRFPGDRTRQAAALLIDWRRRRQDEADVERLVSALKKCGMTDIIDDVERVTHEFYA